MVGTRRSTKRAREESHKPTKRLKPNTETKRPPAFSPLTMVKTRKQTRNYHLEKTPAYYRSYSNQEDWIWKGKPDSHQTKSKTQVKKYEEALNEQTNEKLSEFTIVSLKSNGITTKGEIVFLFEQNNEKQAEIRLFEQKGETYIETLNYKKLGIHKLKPETNETIVTSMLKEPDGSLIEVTPHERDKRTIKHSPLYSELANHKNLFLQAVAKLTLSSVPSKIIGRESEISQIRQFLTSSILFNHSACSLYICGMPGTGKTATFLYTINQLKAESQSFFEFIHINCMKLTNPHKLYSMIWKEISSEEISPKIAVQNLCKYFSVKHNSCIIVLVDEIDALVNRRQDVLYNLFNWTNEPKSNLIVTGIANTMNLSEKFISKVSSRMGSKEIVFAPYKREQMQSIIQERLQDTFVFSNEAVLFCSAKIASYNGDARRAFQVCKRAALIANERKKEKVGLLEIENAFKELFGSVYAECIKILPFYLELFLVSICLDLKHNSSEYGNLIDVKDRANTLCETVFNMEGVTTEEAYEVFSRLESYRICLKEKDSIKLNVSPDEVIEALKETVIFTVVEPLLIN